MHQDKMRSQCLQALSSTKCLVHLKNTQFVDLVFNDINNEGSSPSMIGIPLCEDCKGKGENRMIVSFTDIQSLQSLCSSILNSFHQPIKEIKSIKQSIKCYLNSKLLRRRKYVTFYQELSEKNKKFLEEEDSIIQLVSKEDAIKRSQHQTDIHLVELKKWIKDPEAFEKLFHIEMNKNSLKALLHLRFSVLENVDMIRTFFSHMHLTVLTQQFQYCILKLNIKQLCQFTSNLVEAKKNQIINKKLICLKQTEKLVRMESKIQEIDLYMTKFYQFYKQLGTISNQFRFSTNQKTFLDFNLDIQLTTVILRNPNLNQEQVYREPQCESQFAFINDGEYIFKNQYRADIFCNSRIQLERSQSTMIGRQFFVKPKNQVRKGQFSKFIQIQQPLKPQQKVYMQLRLNYEQFDKITVVLLCSSSVQKLIPNQRDIKHRFSMYIVPDSGENSSLYGFKEGFQISRQVMTKNPLLCNYFSQQDAHLVLEDDFISIQLCTDFQKVILRNETRRILLSEACIQCPVESISQMLRLRLPVYAGIILYSTIPQIVLRKSKPT